MLGQQGPEECVEFDPVITSALNWQQYCPIFIQIIAFVQQGWAQGASGSLGIREFPFPGQLIVK